MKENIKGNQNAQNQLNYSNKISVTQRLTLGLEMK